MQPIPRKNFPSLIGQMPINDFRKINIGSVLNEVARVKIVTNGIGSVQFSQCSYQDRCHPGVHRTNREAKMGS